MLKIKDDIYYTETSIVDFMDYLRKYSGHTIKSIIYKNALGISEEIIIEELETTPDEIIIERILT